MKKVWGVKQFLVITMLLFSVTALAVDTDGDGVDDSIDAFPTEPGGATDTDGDGKPDTLLGGFLIDNFSSGFSANPWTSSSSWAVRTGGRSGNAAQEVSQNSGSYLRLTRTFAVQSTLMFYYRNFAANNCGAGNFAVDGSQKFLLNNFNWVRKTIVVSAGTHTLQWNGDDFIYSLTGTCYTEIYLDDISYTTLMEDTDDDNDGVPDTKDFAPLDSSIYCASGKYWNNSSCATASAGYYVPDQHSTSQTACAVGTYQPSTGQTSCITATTCALGSTYETTAPTSTTNRACSVVSTCGSSEYEVSAPTLLFNRLCSTLTACGVNEYESTAPTTTSDRVCSVYTEVQDCASYSPTSDACMSCQSGYSLVGGICSLNVINHVKNDFSPDGKADLLLRNSATGDWSLAQLNGLTVLNQSTVGAFSDIENVIVSTADFDGDGTADILTRGTDDGLLPGTFHIDLTNGATVTGSTWLFTMSTDLNDEVMSTKDFNKDGKADVLLRNKVTGVWTINYMNGTNDPTTSTLNASVDLCYTMKGDGDYDGNGYPDLLLRKDACGGASYPWLINTTDGDSTILASGVPTGVSMNTGWAAVVTDKDFNGDGKSDVLIRAMSGSVQQWLLYDMNGAGAPSANGLLNIAVQSMWQFAADTDFNGDGKEDLVLRSTDTGQWYGYLLDGRTLVSNGVIAMAMNPIWTLQSLDDFNGDAKNDILLRNSAGGQWWLYLMNGLTVQANSALPVTMDLNYVLQND